jgi:hypothetical protein
MTQSQLGHGMTVCRAGIALAALLACTLPSAAQPAQPSSGGPVSRLTARAAVAGESIRAADGSAAERVTLDAGLAPTLLQLGPEQSARVADWPVAPGLRADVLLTRHEVYAADARIIKVEGRRQTALPRSRLAFYWGFADDDPEIRVFASVDPVTAELSGFAQTRDGLHELRRDGLAHRVAKPEAFLPADATAAGPPRWSCGEENLPRGLELPFAPTEKSASAAAALTGLATATVAIDTDNELMLGKFNDDTTAATNYLASLFAAIDVMYERDLLVRLVQGTTFLRVSTTADPYVQVDTAGADPNELNEFSTYWNNNFGSVQRAVAAMISGKQGSPNSASGIAWINGLCSKSVGYSFSQVFKISYLAGDALVVGHEIGHNFGSPHTHCYSPPIDMCFNSEPGCYSGPTSCPAPSTINTVTGVTGTIMSYCHLLGGCSSSMVFHPRTVALVSPNITAALNVCIFPLGASTGTSFFTVTPCRVVDTRNPNGPLAGPALAGGAQRTFPVAGVCGIPSGAKSIAANVTVISTTAAGSLTSYAGNATPPGTTAISFKTADTRANNTILLLATDGTGTIGIQNNAAGTVQLIVDVDGYFQ